MCSNRKIEYGCSENKPFGVAYNKCAERLFLWDFVRGEVIDCTPKVMQVQIDFRRLGAYNGNQDKMLHFITLLR